jgi:hypothetical protein
MTPDWEIRPRGHKCTRTGKQFVEGELIYTLLFQEHSSFRREDLSEQAWQSLQDTVQPFSFWRSTYEAPPAPPPEPVRRQTGENLLRRLLRENRPEDSRARYILALMLERKKVLRQVDIQRSEDGRLLIYEHLETGEVLVIADPLLHLSEIESVQKEVAARLEEA